MANLKFKERQYEAEILGELYERLEADIRYIGQNYEKVGEEDGQDKWDYIDIPDEELDENRKLKIKVIRDIMVKLEKLL